MKRILSAAAVVALGLSLLTACGDDDGGGSASGSGDYCKDLESGQKSLEKLKSEDLSGLSETIDQFHTLRDEAPDEVADDWKVLSEGLDEVISAFEKAGVTEEDIEDLQNNQVPEDVDMADIKAALAGLKELGTEEFVKAGTAIRDHAKDECGIDLLS